jgi:hypothetical protein
MSENRDEDLLKIQIISEHCHTVFTSKSSLIVGALIGFLVLFYTLLYSGTFSPLTFWVSFFSWSAVCVYYIRKISKEHQRDITKISGMIEKVKQGEDLPSLKELIYSDKDEKEPKIQNKQGKQTDKNKGGTKMAEQRLKRLDLFEVVVFGLYGNWLITFLSDKISFEKFPLGFNVFGSWYQEVCVALAFGCLLFLFALSVFRPDLTRWWSLFVIYMGHTVSIYMAFVVEGMEKPNLIFMVIGLALFYLTFIIELRRIKINKQLQIPPAP